MSKKDKSAKHLATIQTQAAQIARLRGENEAYAEQMAKAATAPAAAAPPVQVVPPKEPTAEEKAAAHREAVIARGKELKANGRNLEWGQHVIDHLAFYR